MPAEHLGITGMTPQTVDRSVVSHADIHLKPIGELSAKTDSTNQPIRPREVLPTVRKGWHSDSWKTDLCPMTSSPRKTLIQAESIASPSKKHRYTDWIIPGFAKFATRSVLYLPVFNSIHINHFHFFEAASVCILTWLYSSLHWDQMTPHRSGPPPRSQRPEKVPLPWI